MKAKFIYEAKSISDILIPKNKDVIMSDLLETDIENVPVILKIYKRWKSVYDKDLSNDEKLNFFNEEIFKNYNFKHEQSTGFLGLKRTFNKLKYTTLSTKQMQFNKDVALEVINMWMNWVSEALKIFYTKTNNSYISESSKTNIAESIVDFLKPKSEQEIVNAFHQSTITNQVIFLEDKENEKIIPFNEWPTILKIFKESIDDIKFNKYFKREPIEMITYHSDFGEPITIGVVFKIEAKDFQHISVTLPYVMVEQLDNEKDNVRVYMKNEDNKKTKYINIQDSLDLFEEFWDWLMKAGYYRVIPPNERNEIIKESKINNVFKSKSNKELKKLYNKFDYNEIKKNISKLNTEYKKISYVRGRYIEHFNHLKKIFIARGDDIIMREINHERERLREFQHEMEKNRNEFFTLENKLKFLQEIKNKLCINES